MHFNNITESLLKPENNTHISFLLIKIVVVITATHVSAVLILQIISRGNEEMSFTVVVVL